MSDSATSEHENDQLATDAGTDTEAKTVSVRLDDPEIVAALESAESQSEAIRNALRRQYRDETADGDAQTTTADGGPTQMAIEAYEWMVDYAGVGGRIGIKTARSQIAQKVQIKSSLIDTAILGPLKNNGWIEVNQDIWKVSIVVKPRPDDQATDTTAEEVPADD